MKKTLSITLAALLGAHFANAQQETLFFSDFAPDPDDGFPWAEFPSDDGEGPPGWRDFVEGQRWVDVDSGFEAIPEPADGNGFYGEVFREAGADYPAWWMSNQQRLGGELEYTVSFDFQTVTDGGFANNGELEGEARFHVRFWAGPFDFLAEDQQQLIIGSDVVGDEGFPESGDFETVAVSEPDANGWRTVTLTGFTHRDTVLIDVWAVGEQGDTEDPDDPNRFFGSFGIDNVEIAADPGFHTDFASTIRGRAAVEIQFDTEEGAFYVLESTTDLNEITDEWSVEGNAVTGDGEPHRATFSTGENDRWFFRAWTE